jgi:uncharacterized protein with PIN domain
LRITIEFLGKLNKFLPKKKRNQKLSADFIGKRSVKDLIQAHGIPQTEVGGIKVHSQWVEFSYLLMDGDSILVLPICSSAESPTNPILKESFESKDPAFICDVHLRKLARRLRLLGFDTKYDSVWSDAELADISFRENSILLTRDRGLLMRKKAYRGIYVSNTNPEKQVVEVLKRLCLWGHIRPFSRCLVCNSSLQQLAMDKNIRKTEFKNIIPPKVLEWTNDFHFCPSCKKIYWKGSHYKKLQRMIEEYYIK